MTTDRQFRRGKAALAHIDQDSLIRARSVLGPIGHPQDTVIRFPGLSLSEKYPRAPGTVIFVVGPPAVVSRVDAVPSRPPAA